ncbi:MAG: protein tyrosine phosphatase family protein [Burkholderiales bacterium]|jgi:protein tyrosine phosphatase (PTP) superfamily phosphohydrolase (DUF442 family)
MSANIEDSYNFRKVSEQITTSGVVGAQRLGALASQGYDAVINLLPDSSEHAVDNEREIVELQHIEYIHIPVDFTRPQPQDLHRFTETLDRLAGKKMHIHCAANYRVSAFYAVYAAARGHWSPSQAMDFIRSVWQPADYPAWSGFIAEGLAGDTA